MTWPTVAVTTTNTDAAGDSPASARTDILDLMTKSNQMIAHVSTFAATLLDDASAATARATLGAAISGANNDITSMTALTAGGLPDNSVLTADIANAAVTPAKLAQPFTAVTAVATTSGTSIDFTGIPSWVKRITVMLNGVSTNGTSLIQIQIGSGSIQTTGYLSTRIGNATGGVFYGTLTSGFFVGGAGAATLAYGVLVINIVSGNTYVAAGNMYEGTNIGSTNAGGVTLSGTLDRIRLTTVNGTDTFDAGSWNILYE